MWSDDADALHQMARNLRKAVVCRNCYDDDDITVPFGDLKQFVIGRNGSLYALKKYTELKTSWLRLGK